MTSIRILRDHVINLIAAGEVIERPASVAKELLENALDSGADNITIELEKGGRKSINVRDNGCGMNRHDLLLSIQRHATSKLSEASDLDTIETLGFRGEALPSIAAVSHMSVTTASGKQGWRLQIDGGELRGVESAARTCGTTVSVNGLFYNQPARRKFLRSEATELSWVERFITGCSFARTDVGFTLAHNGRNLFSLRAGQSIEERIRSRYKLSAGTRCISLEGSEGKVRVSLFYVPDQRWNSRRHQFILVNGRLVFTRIAQIPIDRHLSGPAGYPLCICMLDIPPGQVDINMHPSKREVRFRNPREAERAVENALGGISEVRKAATSISVPSYIESSIGAAAQTKSISTPESLFSTAMKLEAGPAEQHRDTSVRDDTIPIIQIASSYLISATDSGLVLVDQHAAHERILFEKVLDSSRKGSMSGQQIVLIPETIKLDPEAMETVRMFESIIREAGFDYSIENDMLLLHAVPAGVRHGIDAIRELLLSLDDPSRADLPQQEQIAAAIACAGSIKFGDRLSTDEARSLLDQLFATSDPFHCPHGRPTLIEIPFEELEKRFGR